jgi:hypothetical protein
MIYIHKHIVKHKEENRITADTLTELERYVKKLGLKNGIMNNGEQPYYKIGGHKMKAALEKG